MEKDGFFDDQFNLDGLGWMQQSSEGRSIFLAVKLTYDGKIFHW